MDNEWNDSFAAAECKPGDNDCKLPVAVATAQAPDFMPVMIYGIVADVLCVLPIIFYLALDSKTGYSKHH